MTSIDSPKSVPSYVIATDKKEEAAENGIRSASESPETLALAVSDTVALSVKAAEAITKSADGTQSGTDSATVSATSSASTSNDDAIWTSIQVTLSRLNEINKYRQSNSSEKTLSKTEQERRIESLKAQIHQLMMTQEHLSPDARTSQLTRLSHELTAILMQYNQGYGTITTHPKTDTV